MERTGHWAERTESWTERAETTVRADLMSIAKDAAELSPVPTELAGQFAETFIEEDTSELGQQISGTLDRSSQQSQRLPDRTADQWAGLRTEEFLIAITQVLGAAGSGESVAPRVLQVALEATVARMALAAETFGPAPLSDAAPVSDGPGDEAAPDGEYLRTVLSGFVALLRTAKTAAAVASAADMTASPSGARRSTLLAACEDGVRAHRALTIVGPLLNFPLVPLAVPENLASLGRACLELGWVELGCSLLENAERLLPKESQMRAEATIDLALLDSDVGLWDQVARRAVPAMLCLDSERYDKVFRERRLKALGRADLARELAFRAAIELDDHQLLAELVDATARFGTHLPLRQAAADRPRLMWASTFQDSDEPALVVAPLPPRRHDWPSRIEHYLHEVPK